MPRSFYFLNCYQKNTFTLVIKGRNYVYLDYREVNHNSLINPCIITLPDSLAVLKSSKNIEISSEDDHRARSSVSRDYLQIFCINFPPILQNMN